MEREERMVWRTGKRMFYTTMCHNKTVRGGRGEWVGGYEWMGREERVVCSLQCHSKISAECSQQQSSDGHTHTHREKEREGEREKEICTRRESNPCPTRTDLHSDPLGRLRRSDTDGVPLHVGRCVVGG
jgi:hypothetical protein